MNFLTIGPNLLGFLARSLLGAPGSRKVVVLLKRLRRGRRKIRRLRRNLQRVKRLAKLARLARLRRILNKTIKSIFDDSQIVVEQIEDSDCKPNFSPRKTRGLSKKVLQAQEAKKQSDSSISMHCHHQQRLYLIGMQSSRQLKFDS